MGANILRIRNRVYDYVELPKGTIKKLIGRELSWDDEPVELKEERYEKKRL